MIVIDHQPSRVSVSVFGEFTLPDYKEFEEVVNYKVKFEGPVDLFSISARWPTSRSTLPLRKSNSRGHMPMTSVVSRS